MHSFAANTIARFLSCRRCPWVVEAVIVATATLIETFCIVSYVVGQQAIRDAALSLCAAVLFAIAIVLTAHRVTLSKRVRVLTFVSAMFYVGYKFTNLAVTVFEERYGLQATPWLIQRDLLDNLQLLAAGVALFLSCVVALREAYAAAGLLKQQNAALRESRERMTLISEQTREVIWEVDAAGRYTFVSPSSLKVFGFAPCELIGRYFYDLFPEEERERLLQEIEASFRSGAVIREYLNPIRCKDGHVIEVSTNGVPIRTPEGALCGYRGSDRDVTELRAARAEQRLLHKAIESAAESFVITDAAGTISYVNPAFLALTGYGREEVLGQTPRILRSGLHSEGFYREFWGTLQRGKTWHGRFTNRRKNGTLFDEDTTVVPLRNEEGKVTHFVAVKRDITEQLELERHLSQRIRYESVGLLATGVAHDFNSVLSLIVGHTEIALEQLPPEHPARPALEAALRAGYRSCALVGKLLAFSGRQGSQSTVQPVAPIVRETVALVAAFAPPGLQVSEAIDDAAGLVEVEAGDLQQVVINLCVNAIQALDGHSGELVVRVRPRILDQALECTLGTAPPGAYAELEVEDSGPGIAPEILPHIFQPNFTTKAAGEGSGLGLTTVAAIAQGWRAAIQVSHAPVAGAVFSVLIPLAQTAAVR